MPGCAFVDAGTGIRQGFVSLPGRRDAATVSRPKPTANASMVNTPRGQKMWRENPQFNGGSPTWGAVSGVAGASNERHGRARRRRAGPRPPVRRRHPRQDHRARPRRAHSPTASQHHLIDRIQQAATMQAKPEPCESAHRVIPQECETRIRDGPTARRAGSRARSRSALHRRGGRSPRREDATRP